jgi:hypothetical protein
MQTIIGIAFFLATAVLASPIAPIPITYQSKSCQESQEYYTTTRIINHSILYSITTPGNQSTITEKVLYNNPTFENYLDLATRETNISLHGKVIFEYEILTPCHYTCAMEVRADYLTSRTLARYFETFYQPGHTYPMLCNSYGCRAGSNYCETFQIHDEL